MLLRFLVNTGIVTVMLCQHRPVTVCSSVNQGPHTYCPADFPISLSLVLLSGGASKVHKLTCPWFSHSCFRFPHHICDFHLHLSTAISTTTVLPLISNSRMKGYLFACLLTLFMVASAFAGPNQSKCIKEQATIVKATEKEATQGEVRVLLNRKGLPNELVDMVLA